MKAMADLSFRERRPDYRNQYSRLKSKDARKRFLDCQLRDRLLWAGD